MVNSGPTSMVAVRQVFLFLPLENNRAEERKEQNKPACGAAGDGVCVADYRCGWVDCGRQATTFYAQNCYKAAAIPSGPSGPI